MLTNAQKYSLQICNVKTEACTRACRLRYDAIRIAALSQEAATRPLSRLSAICLASQVHPRAFNL